MSTTKNLSDCKATPEDAMVRTTAVTGQNIAHTHTGTLTAPLPTTTYSSSSSWPTTNWFFNDDNDAKFRTAVKSSLNDNIDQNKGNLKMTRSFMEAVIESAILKTDIKFKNKNINDVVTAACDKLISVDSPEVNVPACMININELSERMYTEICKHIHSDLEEQSHPERFMKFVYHIGMSVLHPYRRIK
jgi:hypothetical protein